MKRTELRRKAKKPKKKRIGLPGIERELPDLPKKTPYAKKRLKGKAIDIANSQAFRLAARDQRVCAVCGEALTFDAHHVIEKSYLKRNSLPLFVTDNALRVCDEFTPNDCHGKHTRRNKRIPLRCLTEWNIRYAFYLLESKAPGYLRRTYAGDDPRVDAMEKDLTTE